MPEGQVDRPQVGPGHGARLQLEAPHQAVLCERPLPCPPVLCAQSCPEPAGAWRQGDGLPQRRHGALLLPQRGVEAAELVPDPGAAWCQLQAPAVAPAGELQQLLPPHHHLPLAPLMHEAGGHRHLPHHFGRQEGDEGSGLTEEAPGAGQPRPQGHRLGEGREGGADAGHHIPVQVGVQAGTAPGHLGLALPPEGGQGGGVGGLHPLVLLHRLLELPRPHPDPGDHQPGVLGARPHLQHPGEGFPGG